MKSMESILQLSAWPADAGGEKQKGREVLIGEAGLGIHTLLLLSDMISSGVMKY